MLFGGRESYHFAVGSPQHEESPGQFLVGVSALFRQVITVVDTVAANDCVVLLEGESGTGKELVARRIHRKSQRADGPFIPVSCPAITESLFESQFYGHMKGAFTGASSDTLGVVRAAEHGTLMLDEVGELPLNLQPKLLRLLQEREVTPVGMSHPISVNTRFIAATNRSLARCTQEGTFRRDLYHRLNIVCIEIPPLRSRPEDINPLLDYYLDHYSQEYQMPKRNLGNYLRNRLIEYHWPGNVRELCGYIERLYATNSAPIAPAALSAGWNDGHRRSPDGGYVAHDRMPAPQEKSSAVDCFTLAEAEGNAIRRALDATGNNRSAAARLLAIHRSTLLRKIRSHGLG